MEKILVLNLLFKPKSYSADDIKNINGWIGFFHEHGIRIIATPPIERIDVCKDSGINVGKPALFEFLPVASFDTCDRWHVGLRRALEKADEKTQFYLWSADFKFTEDSKAAAEALINHNGIEDLVVGTIQATKEKQTIDDYATFPLLEHWFIEDYNKIKENGLAKPRSELLRFSKKILEKSLKNRWYPTEQTIYLILQCFWDSENLEVMPLQFSNLSDSIEARNNKNVIQQVERMELWLKYMWRDKYKHWSKEKYLSMCKESFGITIKACERLLSQTT